MKQQANRTQGSERARIADKPGCGPSVDTWPILDKQGRPIPDDEGKSRSRRS